MHGQRHGHRAHRSSSAVAIAPGASQTPAPGGRDAARFQAAPDQPRRSARPHASRRNDRYDCRAGRRRMGRPTARTLACAACSSGPGRDGAVTVASGCLNALPGNPGRGSGCAWGDTGTGRRSARRACAAGRVLENPAAGTGHQMARPCNQPHNRNHNCRPQSVVLNSDAYQMKGMFTMRASTITGRRMLAAGCLIPVAVFLAAACGSAGTGAAPAKTITVTTTPSSPTPAAPASSGTSQCTTADLRLTVGAANGAAGTIYYPLDFTNASSSACTMYGYPGVAFVSSPGGSQVGAAAGAQQHRPGAGHPGAGRDGARHARGQRRADR